MASNALTRLEIRPSPSSSSSSILALDLGTTTGWALGSATGSIISGTVSFKPSRYDGGGMRFVRFRNWLNQLHADSGTISAVYFEEVRRHAGTDAAHVFGGLLAILSAWCEEHGIPYQGVPVGSWKRQICGKGNASKDDVIAAIRARDFKPIDTNEADAVAILLWALQTNGGVA